MPKKFMPNKIPKYEGKRDLEEHLTKYMTQMNLRGTSLALKCKAFHLTYAGATKVWYSRLPHLSIRSWPDLKKAILNQYLSRKEGDALVQHLHDMRQALGEMLKSYLARLLMKSYTANKLLIERLFQL